MTETMVGNDRGGQKSLFVPAGGALESVQNEWGSMEL